MKKILKRGMAYLLTAAMVMGLVICTPSDMMNVQAADGESASTTTGKTVVGLGTSGIADPETPTGDSDAWKGSYVYFGTYDTDGDSTAEPVKYRVLDSNTTVYGGTTMLLDCDSVLWAGSDPSSAFDATSNVWADSDIRTYLNGTFLTGNFSATEQSAIASSTKSAADSSDGDGWSALNYAELNNDKIFFLDAKEATNESYGYSNTDYDATNRVKTGGNAYWWLRSADTSYGSDAGYVYSDGYIFYTYVSGYVDFSYVGVSPALNVNRSSVLFTSVISGTAGETGAEYKLTLLDSNMTIAGNGTVTRNGDTVTIPYTISGTNSANATQVSVLLLDKEYTQGNTNDAEVLYYGALDISVDNGTGTFTLPYDFSDKVCGRDYYAYIVAEDENGSYETDYASIPVKVTIPWLSKKINLRTNGMVNPIVPTSTSDAWTGSYVYFGTYNGSPVKYRVLDSETSVFGGTTMLLDCDSILWGGGDLNSTFDEDTGFWVDSDIRGYLNGTFLTGNFSTTEQDAIASSTKNAPDSSDGNGWSWLNYVELINDKIFFLDAKEATNESYGYSDTDDESANKVKTGGNGYWWLRSIYIDGDYIAGCVDNDCCISALSVWDDDGGVSPALNVNLSSVLFTSSTGASKSSAITEYSSCIGTTTGAEWKLTLYDTGKTIKVTDNKYVVKSENGIITVPYTYTDTAAADVQRVNQISVMITDKAYTEADANILYYGALQDASISDGGTTGTGTFVLPSATTGTLGTDYYVYIIAEHVSGDNVTDYASEPVEIDIYNEVSSVSLEVDTPVAGTAFDTSVIVASNVRASSIGWYLENAEVTDNAGYNKEYIIKVKLIPDSGYVFADDVVATVNNNVAIVEHADDGIVVNYTFPPTGKGSIGHTATGYNGTYDGAAHSITVEAAEPEEVTISYSTDAGDNKNYTTEKPTFTDAGEYMVYYKIENEDYNAEEGSQIVRISKKKLTIKAVDQTITYGNSIDRTKYTVTGLVDGHSIKEVTLIPSTVEVTDSGTLEVNSVIIMDASGKDVTVNYDITYAEGKLVVNEAEEEPQPDETTPDEPIQEEPENPNTGDNSSLGVWFALLVGSGTTAVVFWKKKKYIVEE